MIGMLRTEIQWSFINRAFQSLIRFNIGNIVYTQLLGLRAAFFKKPFPVLDGWSAIYPTIIYPSDIRRFA